MLPALSPTPGPASSTSYEAEHVHTVYQHIAPHFSATRFKPWPVVESFLLSLPAGAIGLDIGCGNGKYLTVNPEVFIIGSDRSSNLVDIAHGRRVHDTCVADALDLPHPQGRFDFAISIAVIHHFSSAARRVEAVRSIIGTLKPGEGRALVYVWALEQKGSRRGWEEGGEQDVFVPWVLQKQYAKKGKGDAVESGGAGEGEPAKEVTFQRYYHLYRQGELEADIDTAGGVVIESGYQKDNWWAICGPKV